MVLFASQWVGVSFRLESGLAYSVGCARASVVRKTLCGSSWDTITTSLVLQSVDGSLNSLLGMATRPKGPHSDQVCKQRLQDFLHPQLRLTAFLHCTVCLWQFSWTNKFYFSLQNDVESCYLKYDQVYQQSLGISLTYTVPHFIQSDSVNKNMHSDQILRWFWMYLRLEKALI